MYLEAYGSLLKLLLHGGSLGENADGDEIALSWAIPFVGHWAVLGFAAGLHRRDVPCSRPGDFVWIRVKNAPKDLGRKSRFFGSHLGPVRGSRCS